MTYRVISPTETDPDSPVTSTLMIALDENPTGIAAGDLNAPKLALKSEIGTITAAGSPLDFNGLDAWSGVWFSFGVFNSNASGRNISFDATIDGGANYLGAEILFTVAGNNSHAQAIGFFDFATGVVHGTVVGSLIGNNFNETIAGASLAINGVRFSTSGSINGAAMIHPNGGESAT